MDGPSAFTVDTTHERTEVGYSFILTNSMHRNCLCGTGTAYFLFGSGFLESGVVQRFPEAATPAFRPYNLSNITVRDKISFKDACLP